MGAKKVALAEHEEMWRWKRLPLWAQQELEQWRLDEACQRQLVADVRACVGSRVRDYRSAVERVREIVKD